MTTPHRHLRKRLLITLAAASVAFAAGAQDKPDDIRLPDLGSSANALITPQEAQDYGAMMLQQMRALDMVVDDPLLDDYINNLGFRLVANSAKPKDHFAFFIAKDPVINAFSAPGGYIGIDSGLIVITRNEDELAAVMAHEIGHITQNHLQRAYESAKKDTPLMALIALGAIAAGGAAGGQAAAATLLGGQGVLMQKEINFTRKDEAEADRTGIETLAKSGYDPNAMAGFFQRMEDEMSADSGGFQVPSLLQDHPVTAERISDAKARAGTLIAAQKLQPSGNLLDKNRWAQQTAPIAYVKDPTTLLPAKRSSGQGPNTYLLMRERVRVLSDDAYRMANYYAGLLGRQDGRYNTPENHYGYALALTRSGQGGKAVAQLQPLLDKSPDNLIIRLAMADARLQAGERGAALDIYAALNTESPRNKAVGVAYANALTFGGSTEQATQAAQLLRPMLEDTDEPSLFTAYARASEKAGDKVRAGEAYAQASYLSGRPFDAMEQLKTLLKRNDLDYYARARIQAHIAELTPLVMELRKRRVSTDDNPDGTSQTQQQFGSGCKGRLCFSMGANGQ
ncbi:M48 family metalloprotease [Dyella nitratireducens]|uniref:Beta-barrel assembly-enhancing protease n=1 Tax=Dyella nitratireducens TaxID=1849580 RepID=A0ABQ1FL38_9GAMM|nr:M48 family metalloprotease [Dyella nitratireducens]GGA19061.1 putative beta-barrel assembly-enhancing protease [Dyella nitratireducens]GLQ44568.1 putative beta-barrel assembly-enhancing protease [Dyella nitratireducens]